MEKNAGRETSRLTRVLPIEETMDDTDHCTEVTQKFEEAVNRLQIKPSPSFSQSQGDLYNREQQKKD